MKITIKSTIDYFSRKPRTLFLVDGLGAALTTFSLFFVLRPYYDFFGMPVNILTYLSVMGLIYCAYSMSCYFLLKNYWAPYLRIIGISNFLYCILTMTFLYSYYNNLTRIGLTYFLAEILIIVLLVYLELRVANMLRIKKWKTYMAIYQFFPVRRCSTALLVNCNSSDNSGFEIQIAQGLLVKKHQQSRITQVT